jgi:hypothetical protein
MSSNVCRLGTCTMIPTIIPRPQPVQPARSWTLSTWPASSTASPFPGRRCWPVPVPESRRHDMALQATATPVPEDARTHRQAHRQSVSSAFWPTRAAAPTPTPPPPPPPLTLPRIVPLCLPCPRGGLLVLLRAVQLARQPQSLYLLSRHPDQLSPSTTRCARHTAPTHRSHAHTPGDSAQLRLQPRLQIPLQMPSLHIRHDTALSCTGQVARLTR